MWPPFRWMVHKRRGLRMWVVSILAAGPRNGAEIINEIERMTHGWWRPSPGSVYPLLDELTQERLVRRREDGRFELTKRAEEELGWSFGPLGRRPETPEDVLSEIEGYAAYLEDLGRADPSGLAAHGQRIRRIIERLTGLLGPGR